MRRRRGVQGRSGQCSRHRQSRARHQVPEARRRAGMTIIGGDLATSGTSRNTSSREVFGRRLFDPMESADGPAILGPETISYPDLLRRVDRLGSRLRKAGVREDTRVGICLEPTPSYVIALLAVLRMGAKVVLLSPGWTAEEVRRCVTTTQPAFLIARSRSSRRGAGVSGESPRGVGSDARGSRRRGP